MFFCLSKKIFFTSIRFLELSKKLYFRYSKRTFKPVYLENNCSHKKFSKLRKSEFWLFLTEIVAKKLFKYFLTYKSKEINAKSFFPNLAPLENSFFRGFRFIEVCYKIWRLNQNGWIIDSEVTEFWRASRAIRALPRAASVLPGILPGPVKYISYINININIYNSLENSKNRILVKKFFLAEQKNTCLFIVDKELKKNYLVQICDIDCPANMEWPIYMYNTQAEHFFYNEMGNPDWLQLQLEKLFAMELKKTVSSFKKIQCVH